MPERRMQKRTRRRNRRWRTILRLDSGYVVFGRSMRILRTAVMWKMESAFEADDFLSLEEEENCTTYLLRFLMEHYKLPTAIWKLLDEKIHIVQNAGAFRERFPAQFVSYMVHKCESGEEVDFPSSVVRKMRITISFCNIMTELIRRCRRKNYRKRSR